jgi:hypothetical protein
MPSSLDAYMPKMQLEFPDGSILSLGTVSCDDQIHQAVYLGYTPAGSATPTMELELPPKTVEVIIRLLQERANEARFVNGEKMLEYAEPAPSKPREAKSRAPRRKADKKANDRAAKERPSAKS